MSILKIARAPAVTIEASSPVLDGIRLMEDERVGALLVMDSGQLCGTFGERDVMRRVLMPGRDPAATEIREVMTSPVWTIAPHQTVDEAVALMVKRGVRRLPVLNGNRIEGIVSLRYSLREKAERLNQRIDSLFAFLCADGIGG